LSFAPQANYSVHFSSLDHIAIRHPGQVHLRRTRAGIQMDSPSTSLDEIPLDPSLQKGEDFEVISFQNSTHAQSSKKTMRNH
jgi:hypothetical protein